jgi:hypothetical protein
MKRTSKSNWILLICLTSLSLSCNKSWEDYFNPNGISDHTYRGPVVKMGNGTIRSYFVVSPTGVPLKLGVELTDAALTGLPTDPNDFMGNSFQLSIPQKAKDMTAFDHIVVDWNPHGHPPNDVYGEEHFDIHFYKMTPAQRKAIPPYSPETAALYDNHPPDGYVPQTFVPTPGGVPQMGKHWVDTKAPEYNGGAFSKTFIYGTYNGAVNFYEPMATHELLESGVTSSTPFDQPKYVAPDETYYPTTYDIGRDAKKHTHSVSLANFVWRPSSN